jgi:hypothetical protein
MDVSAIQRALTAEGSLKPGSYEGRVYAQRTWEAVQRLQRKHGFQTTGNYGRLTHTALTPWFDAYGRWLLLEEHEYQQELKAQQADPRNKIVTAAWFYYGERADIGYNQARPIPTIHYGIRPPQTPSYLDCSGLYATCMWLAGKAHLLGPLASAGYGNTWEFARHGSRISVAQLRPGDAVYYGSDLGHMAVYVGGGRVISHGSARGPLLLPHDYRGINQCRSYLP